MVWAKLDDEILDNEKITRAGVLGFALHVAAITWCSRKLTDGFVPYARVRLLLDLSELDDEYLEATASPVGTHDSFRDGAFNVGPVQAEQIAKRLVRVGLWREDADRGGYWIHDFLDYNPSKEEAEAAKQSRTLAGKKGASKRWGPRDPVAVNLRPSMADAIAGAIAPAMADAHQEPWQPVSGTYGKPIANRCPDPDPDPDPDLKDPPVVPQSKPAVDRQFEPGTSGTKALEIFEDAVGEATGQAFCLTFAPYNVRDLCRLLNSKHAPAGDREGALSWLRSVVPDWVANVEPAYAKGYAPSKLLEWLNAKKPRRLAATGTDSPRPSRRIIRDEDLT